MGNNQVRNHFINRVKWGEDILALAVFAALTFLPVMETFARFFGQTGVPASTVIVQHLTLWIGFIGAILAARQNKLLALTTQPLFSLDTTSHPGRWLARTVSFIVVLALFWGSLQLVRVEFAYPINIAPNIPRWMAMVIMPVGFALIAIQMLLRSSRERVYLASIIGVSLLWMIISVTGMFQGSIAFKLIGAAAILTALGFGAPIFVGLGGLAALFFWHDFTPISAIPAETYRIVVSSHLPTIPLFTLAGYLMAESKASRRMINVFRSLFGWIPGGTPVIIVVVSGFFTALTGGSGVTILALGGLFYPLLKKEGYSELFSLGLITVAGSLGLLFPPSLPAIIYGVTGGVSIRDIFIAGLIPGTILVVLVSGWSVWQGKVQKIKMAQFQPRVMIRALWDTKWEIVIPLLILFGIFGGFTTLVETAAFIVVYTLFVEVFIYKDLTFKDLPRIVVDCATLIGGVLIILGVAMGLTSYLVDAQIPTLLLQWVKAVVSSKYVFLILLNVFLLGVGAIMDIFSAIIVVVPLITPLGDYFGVHPVHLAIIFIANLELGYLTPPVGMNLFLSAYRFNKPMPVIYKASLPFFFVRLLAVLAFTYLPFLSLGLLN